MQIDRKVCKIKYDREVSRLRQQEGLLRERGCIILGTTYPYVDLLFLPNIPLTIDAPMLVPQGQQAVLVFGKLKMPSVSGIAFGVRVDMSDYDMAPPSVIFCDPRTWSPLPMAAIPIGHYPDPHGVMRPVVVDEHPKYSRPFLCMEGVREFHEHLQHTDQEWFSSRVGFGLFYIAETIWTCCCINNAPHVFVLPGQVNGGWHDAAQGVRLMVQS